MTLIIPQCDYCRHYREHQKCDAFPDGIPMDILTNKFDHHKPHEDDHGIQFQRI